MTNLNLKFDNETLKKPAELLQEKLNFEISDSGFTVNVCKSERLNITSDGAVGTISYITKASFFRMLTLFVKKYNENKIFDYSESIQIPTCGIMLDMSRNGVMTPEALKEYFSYMAMMGLNSVGLYMESMYTLDGYPYFGYMQGRYTKDELRAIDDYGNMFGIEVYPHIATLSHMEKYLKFREAFPVRDTARMMLVGADATYKLIDAMLTQLKECFRSKKIHLCMDEAWYVGLGEYYKNNKGKVINQGELVVEHAEKVVKMALDHGYDPMIWSSSFRRFNVMDDLAKIECFKKVTIQGGSYEGEGTEETFKEIWSKYVNLDSHISFLGGIQTWYGAAPENNFTLGNIQTFLPYCKKYGIDEVMGSVWMNDGTECNHFMSLLGAQGYAEHMYNENVSVEQIKDMFEFVTGASFDAFMDTAYFFNKNMKGKDLKESEGKNFWGKTLLWMDPVAGVADYNLYENNMSGHYAEMKEKFKEYKDRKDPFERFYDFYMKLFDVMSIKCYIAERLKKAYEDDDRAVLKKAAEELFPQLKEKVETLRFCHRDLWYATYNPFGYEVLDVRYGGLSARCDSAIYRIKNYLEGKVEFLREFEEVRLPSASHYDRMYSEAATLNGKTDGAM